MRQFLIILFLSVSLSTIIAGQHSHYDHAKNLINEVKTVLSANRSMSFNFRQTNRSLGHLAEPWQTNKYESAGTFCLTPHTKELYLSDSLLYREKYYYSKKFFTADSLFLLGYGENEPTKVTRKDAGSYINTAALFSPVFYLDDFLNSEIDPTSVEFKQGKLDTITYQKDNSNVIRFLIDRKKKLVSVIYVAYPHELYGDVLKKITYSEYRQNTKTKTYYPTKVKEEELGIIFNEITISLADEKLDIDAIKKEIPGDYKLINTAPTEPEITYQKFNDHIHLLDFQHTDDRILIVEFEDFLVVAEAPLNSKNGELIIEKAKEIAPDKPIKYFVFGHHHPHYIGGIRAFVANQTTVLCYKDNMDYVNQIISFKHTIEPDILENNRQQPMIEEIDSIKIISDKNLEMQIIHIGEMSYHTKDYLIYYFPKYKLLFEDDLIWIAKDKPIAAARQRQKGVYDAIIKYDLEVDTIIQSWPVNEHGVKTIIDFKDLKKSVELIGKE